MQALTDRSARGLSTKQAEYNGNQSGWDALEYKVIVKKDSVEETTAGGIYVARDVAKAERWTVMEGVIVSQGNLAFTERRKPNGELLYWDPKPEPGDRVQFSQYSGVAFEGDDGEEYVVFQDKEIMCVRKSK